MLWFVLSLVVPLWLVSLLPAAISDAQTSTTISANEAAAHVGEYATVEGVVAKVFTSEKGNTFLNRDIVKSCVQEEGASSVNNS